MGPAGRMAAVLAVLAAACNPEGGQRYTLHTVMLQMDHVDRALSTKLHAPDAALERLEELKRWSEDPAFDAYLASPLFRGSRGDFEGLQSDYMQRLQRAIDAADAGDAEGLTEAYRKMRFSCEVCHLKFRPQGG